MYFVRVYNTDYTDKNKLQKHAKWFVTRYHRHLLKNKSELHLFEVQLKKGIRILNSQHKRCTPLTIQNMNCHSHGSNQDLVYYCTGVFTVEISMIANPKGICPPLTIQTIASK
jgi:hypothetical protein